MKHYCEAILVSITNIQSVYSVIHGGKSASANGISVVKRVSDRT